MLRAYLRTYATFRRQFETSPVFTFGHFLSQKCYNNVSLNKFFIYADSVILTVTSYIQEV